METILLDPSGLSAELSFPTTDSRPGMQLLATVVVVSLIVLLLWYLLDDEKQRPAKTG